MNLVLSQTKPLTQSVGNISASIVEKFSPGSAAWLVALREGAFSNLKPVPWEPPRKPRLNSEVSPASYGLAASAGKCTYCKRDMYPGTPTHPTRDHIIPKSRGGIATVPCCTKCNNAKGDMMPGEWKRFMELYPGWWKVAGREAAGKKAILAERAARRSGDVTYTHDGFPIVPICRR